MGINQSSQNRYQNNNNLSEIELRNRINDLFKNNRKLSQFSALSTRNIPNLDYSSEVHNLRGGGKFTSGRNRYKKYNINNLFEFQQGGGDTSDSYKSIAELNDFSEMDRIRKMITSQYQRGGNISDTFNLDFPTPNTSMNENKLFDELLANLNTSGNMLGGAVESDTDEIGSDQTGSDDVEYDTYDMSDMEYINDYYSQTSDEKMQNEYGINSNDFDVNNYNYDNDYDNVGFYTTQSSSDYSWQHAYTKNRF